MCFKGLIHSTQDLYQKSVENNKLFLQFTDFSGHDFKEKINKNKLHIFKLNLDYVELIMEL